MKKLVSFILMSLIVLAMFAVFAPRTSAIETVIFQDDFESYGVGTFPSTGGWEIVWNGAGDDQQVVTDTCSYSGAKSFSVLGAEGWSCVVQKKFSSSASIIGYEFSILLDAQAASYNEHPGFHKLGGEGEYWGAYYAVTCFLHETGRISSEDNTDLGSWTPQTWYRIRAVLDRTSKQYSVWVNGILKGQNMPISRLQPEIIDSLALVSAWAGVRVYYDDVKVFESCGYFPLGDFSILNVQPVQAVFDSSVPLVAGKATAFNITVRSTFPYSVCVPIKITAQGKTITEKYTITGSQLGNSITYAYLPTIKENLFYPTGSGFGGTVEINPDHTLPELDYEHNGISFWKKVVTTDAIYCLFRPFGFLNDIIPTKMETENMMRGADAFMRAVYPVGAQSFLSDCADPLIAPGYGGWDNLLPTLSVVEASARTAESWGHVSVRIVLIVPDYPDGNWFTKHSLYHEPIFGIHLGMNAFGVAGGLDRVVLVVNGYWTIVAHEIGHTYYASHDDGRLDTGDQCWVVTTSDPKTGLPVGGASARATFTTEMVCALSNKAGDKERMNRIWISNDCYSKLLSQMNPRPDPEVLLISGVSYDNGTLLLNPLSHLGEGQLDISIDSSGNYTVQYLNSVGEVIARTGFNVTFESDYGHLNVTAFCFTIPYVPDTAGLEMVFDETVVAAINVSQHDPSVELIYPNGGESLCSGDNVTILWNGSDADGDSLTYSVFNSFNNGTTWFPLEAATRQTSMNWTIPNESSSNQCRVRVVATDGFNVGVDTSDEGFTIFRHDISVTDLATPKKIIGEGNVLPISITLHNQGNYSEMLDLEVHANDIMIYAQSLMLTAGKLTEITCFWNTTSWDIGNYSLSAYVQPIGGEVDTTNNRLVSAPIQILSSLDIYDIAVLSCTPCKTVVCRDCSSNISVQMANYGAGLQTFNLTICANGTIIGFAEVDLPGSGFATATLLWNTTGFPKGDYIVSVHTAPILGETDVMDNVCVGGTVRITMLGDIASEYDTVDIFDITTVALAFNSIPGDSNWIPVADINNDGTVDIFDIVVVAIHFGETG